MTSWYANWPWILLVTAFMFAGSILIASAVIVRLPDDYLTREQPPESRLFPNRPFAKTVVALFRNACGLTIMGAGFVMLFVPGQGILFILIGLTLLSFPGKKKLVRWLLARPGVMDAMNRLRRRAQRPPLKAPDP